jgi:hypothetical protein
MCHGRIEAAILDRLASLSSSIERAVGARLELRSRPRPEQLYAPTLMRSVPARDFKYSRDFHTPRRRAHLARLRGYLNLTGSFSMSLSFPSVSSGSLQARMRNFVTALQAKTIATACHLLPMATAALAFAFMSAGAAGAA